VRRTSIEMKVRCPVKGCEFERTIRPQADGLEITVVFDEFVTHLTNAHTIKELLDVVKLKTLNEVIEKFSKPTPTKTT